MPFAKSGARPSAEEVTPRLLLISYHFPPGPGVGGRRWERFSRVAVERGWNLDVITLDPASIESPEWSRVRRLPDGMRLFGIPAENSWIGRIEQVVGRLYRAIRGTLKRWFAGDSGNSPGGRASPLPGLSSVATDELSSPLAGPRPLIRAFWAWVEYRRERAWAREAVERAGAIVEGGSHQIVVTSGPPHMAHEAGRLISDRTDLPLVLDFRDPWGVATVLPEHLASPVWVERARRHERDCLSRASLVVTNSEELERRMEQAHPEATARMITVLNGFSEREVVHEVPSRERFVIAYAGSIYLDRDPRLLLSAVSAMVRDLDLGPGELTVEFMGRMVDLEAGLRRLAEQEQLGDHLRLHPWSSRDEVRTFLKRASVLVSLPQSARMSIPSKLYEYMEYAAWIVVQAERGSASEMLLRDTNADVVDPGDLRMLTRALKRRYGQFVRGKHPRPLAREHPEWSSRVQAIHLFDELESWRTGARSTPALGT